MYIFTSSVSAASPIYRRSGLHPTRLRATRRFWQPRCMTLPSSSRRSAAMTRLVRRVAYVLLILSHWLFLHSYIHACIHTYVHTFMHACMHACMHAYIHACMHACMHTCMHACMHAYIHTCIHTYIDTYIRACTPVYTHNIHP